jgi:hypothetical protein
MEFHSKLLKLNESLKNNDLWNTLVKDACREFGVKTIKGLIIECIDRDDNTVIHELIQEAEEIINSEEDPFGAPDFWEDYDN